MCSTVQVRTVVPPALLDVKCSSLHSVITWKDKTQKEQYFIHELCNGLQVKPNMFVSNDTFKIRKALHIYMPIWIQHLQPQSEEHTQWDGHEGRRTSAYCCVYSHKSFFRGQTQNKTSSHSELLNLNFEFFAVRNMISIHLFLFFCLFDFFSMK